MEYGFDKNDEIKNKKTYIDVVSGVMGIYNDKKYIGYDNGSFRFLICSFYKAYKMLDDAPFSKSVIILENDVCSCSVISVFSAVAMSQDYYYLRVSEVFFDHVDKEKCLHGYMLKIFFEKLKHIAYKQCCRMSN